MDSRKLIASSFVIGIDIGGTKFTLALADERGRVVRLVRRRTQLRLGAQGIVDAIGDTVPQLIRLARRRGAEVSQIGVGFGGPVDFDSGTVLLSHHVEGWENYPLQQALESRFGLPCLIDNDGNVGALGEWRFGAGRGHRNVLYVNVGTGIGGGIIVDGHVVRGARNLAGEIGHVTVARDLGLDRCTCGRYGCLESRASGPYIARPAAAVGLRMNGQRDPSRVFELARAGDATARQLIADVTDDLANAIGTAVCLVSPSIVILGGGVSEQGELLLRPLRRALPRYMLPQHASGLKVVRARLGYDAGIMGAIALALEKVE